MTDSKGEYLNHLSRRIGELEHRIHELEDELETTVRDQLSLIFLSTVATTLCMTLSIALLVI
ncbi:MAG: hypothetical protein ACI381_02835 [Candidatus Methanomethylophilaceae archaeon]